MDRAAWDFAIERGLPYGGFVPRGRRDENGLIPPTNEGLSEAPSEDPAARTTLNVCCSDATVVICRGLPAGGTALTIDVARAAGRPILLVNLAQQTLDAAADALKQWCAGHQIRNLNVAGPRQSEDPASYRDALTVLRLALLG